MLRETLKQEFTMIALMVKLKIYQRYVFVVMVCYPLKRDDVTVLSFLRCNLMSLAPLHIHMHPLPLSSFFVDL